MTDYKMNEFYLENARISFEGSMVVITFEHNLNKYGFITSKRMLEDGLLDREDEGVQLPVVMQVQVFNND